MILYKLLRPSMGVSEEQGTKTKNAGQPGTQTKSAPGTEEQ